MFRLADWKLATRLLVPILLIGTLLVGAIALTGYLTTRSALSEAGQTQVDTLAQRAAFAIDSDLSTLAIVPQMLAASELREAGEPVELKQYQSMLPDMLGRLPIALNAYVFFEKQVIDDHNYAEVWAKREGSNIVPAYSNFPREAVPP